MQNLFDLSGKTAIVTGGSRGLGKAIAKGLHEAGVEVVIMGTNNRVLDTANELFENGAPVYGVIADFSNLKSVEKAFESAISKLGTVDILVNNAGMQIRHPAAEFPIEDWEKVLNVNLSAAFVMAQLAGRAMLEARSGKIINIASLLSFSGGLTVPAYAASKGGIAQLTKALANEWAKDGINVNAIAPGYMDTDNIAALKKDEVRNRQLLERIPMGRYGKPEDIVGTVIYLASEASQYVNGTIVTVDGGWMAR
ncbi:MAG: 2-dehydro-3-deoxy-D-gluconate 5-dehydrogenase [Clostridiales bacterium]|jgi:2-deoxy-D-gluconate 3-dehydrogenase|nr:2-dehydro-3-deoxy-D-gluconate 5-dehydrogenase [Clostridiales bacterium]